MLANVPADLSSITDALGPALTRLTSGDPAHGPGAAVSFAADLLDLFCQFNWTGPPLADFTLPFTTQDALVSGSVWPLRWNLPLRLVPRPPRGFCRWERGYLSLEVSTVVLICLPQSKWNAQSLQSLSWNGEVSHCLVCSSARGELEARSLPVCSRPTH